MTEHNGFCRKCEAVRPVCVEILRRVGKARLLQSDSTTLCWHTVIIEEQSISGEMCHHGGCSMSTSSVMSTLSHTGLKITVCHYPVFTKHHAFPVCTHSTMCRQARLLGWQSPPSSSILTLPGSHKTLLDFLQVVDVVGERWLRIVRRSRCGQTGAGVWPLEKRRMISRPDTLCCLLPQRWQKKNRKNKPVVQPEGWFGWWDKCCRGISVWRRVGNYSWLLLS